MAAVTGQLIVANAAWDWFCLEISSSVLGVAQQQNGCSKTDGLPALKIIHLKSNKS
jgi:hypothetical protein